MGTSASNTQTAAPRRMVVLLGGTFDPIHLGHLRLALEIKQTLGADEMRLIPCHQPPHRASPKVGSAERLHMLELAVENCADLQVDARELRRDGASYTVDTLRDLRCELGDDVSVVLCMGTDAFEKLSTWKEWSQLIQLAHIFVVARPGYQLPTQGPEFELAQTHHANRVQLQTESRGGVLVKTLRLLPISATDIRQQLAANQSIQFLVPDAVAAYISEQQLYR